MLYTPPNILFPMQISRCNHTVRLKLEQTNQMLAMMRRNVCVASKITRELAYDIFVRPHLKYASVVWDSGPHGKVT